MVSVLVKIVVQIPEEGMLCGACPYNEVCFVRLNNSITL